MSMNMTRSAYGPAWTSGGFGGRLTAMMLGVLLAVAAAAVRPGAAAAQSAPAGAGKAYTLASDGKAAGSIIVAANADEQVRGHAQMLATYLEKMTGATFTVHAGDGSEGIALGVAGDFQVGKLPEELVSHDALTREAYLIRSHDKGVQLIGATPLAVQHAMWDLLRRLGYRQFYPGPTWEVIPKLASATVAADELQKPDFLTRRIWYGHGMMKDVNETHYYEWSARNRATPGFGLATSHFYQAFIRRHKDIFEAHPEYLALVDGKRGGHKFCISNEDLRKLVVEKYALAHFEQNPDSDCVSMEPSDGGGWCECEACAKLGSVTDRVVLLTNEAARAVAQKYPGKYVGLLAYNEHSPPPSIRVEPNVIVKVQTSFIRGGYTFEQLMSGWRAQGAVVGVGDYYSIYLGDRSRPASQKGSDLVRITSDVKKYYELGARFYMCESSDLWGGIGLGHYLTAQFIWDHRQTDNVKALEEDFFDKAFGPAQEPMRAFFKLIYRMDEGDRRPLIRRDMVARMYRHLQKASELAAGDEAILARIHDLGLYTRYEQMYQTYLDASGKDRQAAAEALLNHVWMMRYTMMLHTRPITVNGARRFFDADKSLTPFAADHKWPTETYTGSQAEQIIRQGVASTQTVDIGFELVDFGEDLVPARALNLPATPQNQMGVYDRIAPMGAQRYYTWLDKPGKVQVRVSGGHIVHYRDIASPVQLTLYAAANPIVGEQVAHDRSVPPDGTEHVISLDSLFEGLHEVTVVPPANRAKVAPGVDGTPWVMSAMLDGSNTLSGSWTMYFYVPRGTKIVGGFASRGRGQVLDGDGKVVLDLGKGFEAPGFFHVEVPQGQDGKLWKLQNMITKVSLLTVPPYLARSAQELMLPREVVEADRPGGSGSR